MKPANFPARKLARKLAAENRKEFNIKWGMSARDVLTAAHTIPPMVAAREIRSKKHRSF